MDRSVEQLATKISMSSGDEVTYVRRNIESLNAIDPRTSSRILSVLESTTSVVKMYVQSRLRLCLTDRHGVESAIEETPHLMRRFAAGDDAAKVVLTEAVLVKAVASMQLSDEYGKAGMVSSCTEGLSVLYRSDFHRLDCFEASEDQANRYFRPIAVAASVMTGTDGVLRSFLSQAPQFMTWVAAQENINDLLRVALSRGTLSPENVTAFQAMEQDTACSLRDGLI